MSGYLNYALTGTWHGGPGNKVLETASSDLDAAFRRHDIAYGDLGSRGQKPYTTYNEADEALIRDLEDPALSSWTNWGRWPALGYFKFKRSFFPHSSSFSRSKFHGSYKKNKAFNSSIPVRDSRSFSVFRGRMPYFRRRRFGFRYRRYRRRLFGYRSYRRFRTYGFRRFRRRRFY